MTDMRKYDEADLLDALNRRDAAEQRVQLVAERIGELEDQIDELRRELADAKQATA